MEIKKLKTILVLGAGHGLGLGFVKSALKFSEANIIATYHNATKAAELINLNHERVTPIQLDPLNEAEVQTFAKEINNIDLCINTIGFLHNEKYQPEKSLRDINVDQLVHSFKVNTTITPLILKHFKNKFTDLSAYLVLGAKVGSIADNQMGGWYGYRASKTALNMMIKNIAIEFKRSKKGIRVLCFHPGTTETELSKPFLAGIKHKVWEVEEASDNLIKLIEKVYPENDLFYFWDGEVLPW
jgi:NAD(P)-dependent dehydrogenase (short-subunit alcohol dehydrogenase family)